MSGFQQATVDTSHQPVNVKTHGPEAAPNIRVQQLTTFGTAIKFDTNIKAESYLRSLNEMIRMAENYVSTGADEQAYILYVRYLTMAVEKLPTHPNFKNLDPAIKIEIKANAGNILTKADSLKHKILEKFASEHEKYLLDEKIRQKIKESEEERLKVLDKEREQLKIQRLELDKQLDELKAQKRNLDIKWTEIKQERKILIAKKQQDGQQQQANNKEEEKVGKDDDEDDDAEDPEDHGDMSKLENRLDGSTKSEKEINQIGSGDKKKEEPEVMSDEENAISNNSNDNNNEHAANINKELNSKLYRSTQ